jgi:zinc protease
MRALRLLLVVVGILAAPLTAHATQITRVVSPGGIEAWLVQVKQIPMLSLEVAWRGGSVFDPQGREGLAEMTAGLLDEGAGELDSQAFQTRLEDRAIALGFSADKDHVRATLRTLSEHRDEAFRLMALALTKARFDPEPVERVRGQLLVRLEREAADPDTIAARTWYARAFPDHPYGRPGNGTPESLKAIGRDDLSRFVRGRLARANMVIGVVGDIAPDALGRLLDATFGALPSEPAAAPEPARAAPATQAAPIVVARDIPQSVVLLGGAGIRRDDPDWYAAYLVNYVLGGGGFASRLTAEVREKRGLAYSVYSYLQPMRYAALQIGGVATRNDRVAESIALIRAEFARLREQGISAEELANAKSFLTGSFPLRLSSNARIAGMLVAMQLENLGIDYIDRYASYIDAVTLADANRVARRLFDPERLLVVVVGQPVGLGG